MTPRQQLRPRVSGAALVTALVLLLVLSVLAVAGVGMAVAELSMAGNEQFRRQAADAASAGIEVVVARLMATPEGSAADGSADSIPLEDSAAQVSTVLRFAGYEAVPPRWSVNKLQARHYVIESTGRAPRGAVDTQHQGVLLVSATSGVVDAVRTSDGQSTGVGR